ncbi:MAG: zinc ribbon domain-containing protein [Dehalococcoidia bacterium]|nr:zinc ribbon domain-containing protein [Dehalococcoidia bacterium]
MPLYDYQCEAGHRYEKRESFGAPAQQPCDQCGKPARRLLNAPPIVFKGSGWYVTDSKRTLRPGADSPASSTDLPSDGGESATEAAPTSNAASETATKKPARSSAKKKAAASSDD